MITRARRMLLSSLYNVEILGKWELRVRVRWMTRIVMLLLWYSCFVSGLRSCVYFGGVGDRNEEWFLPLLSWLLSLFTLVRSVCNRKCKILFGIIASDSKSKPNQTKPYDILPSESGYFLG